MEGEHRREEGVSEERKVGGNTWQGGKPTDIDGRQPRIPE